MKERLEQEARASLFAERRADARVWQTTMSDLYAPSTYTIPPFPTALGAVFLPSFLMFVAADLFWIGVVAGDLYAPLKPVLREKPDAVAALLSWLCIVLGNYAFVLPRTGGGRGSASVVGLVRRRDGGGAG